MGSWRLIRATAQHAAPPVTRQPDARNAATMRRMPAMLGNTTAMEWVYLGHAMWLVRVGELRLLFDPLLDGRHHGSVFDIEPSRRLDAAALRPDFIIVSHRHPDHFNVASLRRLAELDVDSVVVCSDVLVEDTAQRLGFRRVERVDAWQRLELDGDVAMITTPSAAEEIEWGVMLACPDGVAWNQVDTIFRDTAEISAMLERAFAGLGELAPHQQLDLALVRWQPMLEVEAVLGEATAFPYEHYANVLEQIASLNAKTIVPAAAGTRHIDAAAWLNDYVFPVSEARAIRDIQARCPTAQALTTQLGGSYRVAEGRACWLEQDRQKLVQQKGPRTPYRYRPWAGPPLSDANTSGLTDEALKQQIEPWLRDQLSVALAAAYPDFNSQRALMFVLDVCYPQQKMSYRFEVSAAGCSMTQWDAAQCHQRDEDYDILNQIGASQLAEVIAGRAHWGEPLLGGQLRSSQRAYDVSKAGLTRLPIGHIFLYYALSYARSHERWVAYQLE